MSYEWVEAGSWPDRNVAITARAFLHKEDEPIMRINGVEAMLYQIDGDWIAAPVLSTHESITDSFMIDFGPDLEVAKVKFLLVAA